MEEQDLKLTDILAKQRTGLAIVRTTLALERSLMAWLRTAVSMIGFGFTLYTFLFSIKEKGDLLMRDTAPRDVGLFLVGLGIAASFLGAFDYWRNIRILRQKYEGVVLKWFPIFVICSIGFLGLLLIVRIIFFPV